MSPKEAGLLVIEEPNWQEVFLEHKTRWPRLPDYLAEDSAYEATLKDWRRFHKETVDGKDTPAPVANGIVALTVLGIYPPRSLINDIPRGGQCFEEQYDAHMWLVMSQRAWRIVAIEDRMMIFDSFGEQTQVDLNRAKWEKYTEKAVEVLNARPK